MRPSQASAFRARIAPEERAVVSDCLSVGEFADLLGGEEPPGTRPRAWAFCKWTTQNRMLWFEKQRLMNRVAVALGRGRRTEVLQLCDELLRLDPRDVATWSIKATTLRKSGETERAVDAWRSLFEIDPDNFTALRELTDYYRSIGDSSNACRYAQRAIRAHKPGTLTDGDFRFLRMVGRLFGAKEDLSATARRQAERSGDDEQRWLQDAAAFVRECENNAPPEN